MKSNKPVPRGFYILPNLFTTASLFTGFWALILVTQGNIEASAYAILFSGIMDGLDGKVARLTGTSSEFGIQYDSLADLIAFGLAPAFIMWSWQLHTFNRLGIGISFLLVACAALRLARFNVSTVTTSKKFFLGLPSPAAGCSVATFILFIEYLPSWLVPHIPTIALVLTATVALLMVSRIRYFAFKEYGFLQSHGFRYLVVAILLFVCILAAPKLLLFIIFSLYLLSGIIYTFCILPYRNKFSSQKPTPQEPSSQEENPS